MIEEEIISAGSVIIATIGLYFVVRIWDKWRHIDKEILKARVFLDKNFLERNWLYIFLSGATLTFHQFLGILMPLNEMATKGWIFQVSSIAESAVLVFLVILAYEWFILIHKKF